MLTPKETDCPFIYVQQPTGQTKNILLDTNSDGADFHLRRIVNGPYLTGGAPDPQDITNFQLYDTQGRSLTGNLGRIQNEYVMVPEVVYPSGSSIRYDKQTVSVGENCIFFSGVRRFPVQINPFPQRKGNWREWPYAYVVNQTLTVPGTYDTLEFGQQFQQDIRDYDFELRRIFVINTDDGTQSSGLVALTIQDAYGRQWMNAPIPDWVINYGSEYFTNVFPVPPVIVPIGGLLQGGIFNATSGTEGGGYTANIQIVFDGVQRIPC